MNTEQRLSDLFSRNGLPQELLEETVAIARGFERFSEIGTALAKEADLDRFIRFQLDGGAVTEAMFTGLMRTVLACGRHDLFIRLTAYTGGIGVIENIVARMERIVGKETSAIIMDGLEIPPLGTVPEDVPTFTSAFVDSLKTHVTPERAHLVLVGNNHDLDTKAMLPERLLYEKAESLDAYLSDLHERKVKVLEHHERTNTVWFEQTITKAVVDHVRRHPDMLSAVREGDKLHIRKIPYDTEKWLHAEDETEKRYHACHCPFAKASIKNGPVVDPLWCDCSAGFAKVMLEVVLDHPLEILTVKSALAGDDHCAFEISLEGIPYKH